MTPKEKAKELVDKYQYYVAEKDFFGNNVELKNAKQCALIAVNGLIEEAHFTDGYYDRQEYWEKVKQEIEKL